MLEEKGASNVRRMVMQIHFSVRIRTKCECECSARVPPLILDLPKAQATLERNRQRKLICTNMEKELVVVVQRTRVVIGSVINEMELRNMGRFLTNKYQRTAFCEVFKLVGVRMKVMTRIWRETYERWDTCCPNIPNPNLMMDGCNVDIIKSYTIIALAIDSKSKDCRS